MSRVIDRCRNAARWSHRLGNISARRLAAAALLGLAPLAGAVSAADVIPPELVGTWVNEDAD